jgi:hypothetical protein
MMPKQRLILREEVVGAIKMLQSLKHTNPSVGIDRMCNCARKNFKRLDHTNPSVGIDRMGNYQAT